MVCEVEEVGNYKPKTELIGIKDITLNLGWQIDGIHLLNYAHAVEISRKT